jgi:glyoxylase-like metal-dependent hydrolase (beta-lactamase superfamily II)
MQVCQLYDPSSSTCSYLVWDTDSREAALIDPVNEHSSRDINLIGKLDLQLRYTLETHIHTDHITGSGTLRQALNSIVIVHEKSRTKCADVYVRDGDFLPLGSNRINILHTPGHSGCDICLLIPGAVFTGDTLLVNSCGHTSFQSGNAGTLYDSVTQRLFTLPDDTIVYPGHSHNGQATSTIGEEKSCNPRLGGNRTRDEFIGIMTALKLDLPERIHEALPSNLRCGTQSGNLPAGTAESC